MIRGLEGWHFVVIMLVVLVLFGSKKLPDAARSLGRSMRILKAETKGLRDDDTVDRTIDERPDPPPVAPHLTQPLRQSADTARARYVSATEIGRVEH